MLLVMHIISNAHAPSTGTVKRFLYARLLTSATVQQGMVTQSVPRWAGPWLRQQRERADCLAEQPSAMTHKARPAREKARPERAAEANA